MWVFVLKYDSLFFLMDKNNESEAFAQFKRIYKFESDEETY
jgi:hypothetical protein